MNSTKLGGYTTSIGLKTAISVKPLNFQIHGTPLTADAARNAVRKIECEKK